MHMSAGDVGNLVFVERRMDQYVTKSIFRENLNSSAHEIGLESDFVLQHYNDPRHTKLNVKINGFKH